jgi:hypothetical protein
VLTHSDRHVAAVLTTLGTRQGSASFAATAAGYQELVAWAATPLSRMFAEATTNLPPMLMLGIGSRLRSPSSRSPSDLAQSTAMLASSSSKATTLPCAGQFR